MDPYPFEVCGARDLVEARLRRWASRYPSPETAIRVLSALVPLGTLRQAADDLGLFCDDEFGEVNDKGGWFIARCRDCGRELGRTDCGRSAASGRCGECLLASLPPSDGDEGGQYGDLR